MTPVGEDVLLFGMGVEVDEHGYPVLMLQNIPL